ncbi:MAG: hypothetical protein R6X14_03240 [bacterium]
MRDISLDPARSLLGHLSVAELARLAKRVKLAPAPRKPALVDALVTRLDTDEIVELLPRLFPKRGPADGRPPGERLDRDPRRHGEATVQVYARTDPGLGRLLLGNGDRCLQLRLPAVQLFLENRWPVVAVDDGSVPLARLYAGFTARGRVHRAAGMPPVKGRPFILDEGEYGLRSGRLRLELKRSGPLSFKARFMRWSPRTGRPEYLLLPIA